MKKILILAYYFPPCNMPGANRPFGWAKYLHKFGYYPVIITRRWDHEIKNSVDILRETENEIIHEKNDNYEVFYLPYKQNYRDYLYVKFGENKFVFIRRLLTLMEILFQNFTNFIVPYRNIYSFADSFLSKNKDVKVLIATGAPFILFKFAHQLNKKHSIPWIADYRDDWNTSGFSFRRTNKLLKVIEQASERRWVGSAIFHTAVSPYSVDKNSRFLNKQGYTIHNGYFFEDLFNYEARNLYDELTISFIGTLYPTQKIEIFLDGFIAFIEKNNRKANIKLLFPGLAFDLVQKQRIINYLKGYEPFFEITERIPKENIIEIENRTHAFLYCSHNVRGVIGSKIYEYVGLKKTVIFCPSDNDIIENIFTETGVGMICNDSDSVKHAIEKLYFEFSKSKSFCPQVNEEKISFYSRLSQTKILADIFDKVSPVKGKMKKILILSYFFPPSTFTGSFRIFSWAKYLSEFGYYPIIVTRNWDIPINEYKDMSESTSLEIVHKKYDNYEVYYLPYKGNLRDWLFKKYGDKKMVLPRRILTFFEVVLQNFSTRVIPFRNLFKFSDKLLESDQEIMCMITSGKPYILFNFCHKLSKKYNLPWIADYRDDWNTSQFLSNMTFKDKFISNLEKRSEKKWLSNSTCFSTVSKIYVKAISDFIKKPGYVVMNGFDPDDYAVINKKIQAPVFTILFNGTLYDSQPVDIFVDAFKLFLNNTKTTFPVKLVFLGLSFEKKQADRIRKLLNGYEAYYEITNRVDKKSALEIMGKAHVFLMFSHSNIKGVTSSKLFDYLALGRPIILCPSDNEILEKIIESTKSGFICNTSNQVYEILLSLFAEFKENGAIHFDQNKALIENYSRKNQTNKLAKVLDNVFSGELENESLLEETAAIRKISFNILNNKLLRTVLRQVNGSKSVVRLLCFHNISEKSDLSYPSIKPEPFYELIKYLTNEYDIIPVSEVHNIPVELKRPLVLTFDDGYKNFIEYALPVLSEFKVSAINNIIVDCVDNNKPFWTQRLNYSLGYIYRNYRKIDYSWEGISLKNNHKASSPLHDSLLIYKALLSFDQIKREDFLAGIEDYFGIEQPDNWGLMNWQDIKYCVEQGIEIGSHTMTHNSLVTINDESALRFEVEDSKKTLEKHLGLEISTLAFPNGIYDDKCLEIATRAGYKYLLTTEEKFFKKSNLNNGYPLILPRISINSNDNNENILRVENFHNLIKFKG
jgi:peptidoglycan/xylan/chitin deacetylase (PgdA/CDA1 family)